VTVGHGTSRWVWGLAVVAGVVALVLGGCLGLLPLLFPTELSGTLIPLIGYGLIALTLGLSLFVVGIRGWQQRPVLLFHSRWAWVVFLLLSLVLGAVGVSLPSESQSGVLFGAIHFALIALPGLLIFSLLSLAAGASSALSIRRMLLGVVGGAASIVLALPVEVIGFVLSAVAVTVVMIMLPQGGAEIDRVMQLLGSLQGMTEIDESDLLALLSSPLVLATLGVTLAVITPAIEEAVKTLATGVLGLWRKTALLPSFLMGAACGLGFALFEGVGNGALGLATAWGAGVALRFLATGMHALTSGIVGLGWGWFWRGKRWLLPLCYVTAFLLHGLWNLNVVLSLAGASLMGTSEVLASISVAMGVLIQLGLVMVVITGLIAIPFVLRRGERGDDR